MNIKKHFEKTKFEDVLSKKLTKREVQVLSMYASGFEIKEVSKVLFISINTVKTHLSTIRLKINLDETANLRVGLCLFWHVYHQQITEMGGFKKCKLK